MVCALLFQTVFKGLAGLIWSTICASVSLHFFFLLMHPFISLTGKQIGSVWPQKCLWLCSYYVPLNQFEATSPRLCSVLLISLCCLAVNSLKYGGEVPQSFPRFFLLFHDSMVPIICFIKQFENRFIKSFKNKLTIPFYGKNPLHTSVIAACWIISLSFLWGQNTFSWCK